MVDVDRLEVLLRRHGFLDGTVTEEDRRCTEGLLKDLQPKCEGCDAIATLCETCALDRAAEMVSAE
jgi:hypothetical protein